MCSPIVTCPAIITSLTFQYGIASPEGLGVVAGGVILVSLFLFIPVVNYELLAHGSPELSTGKVLVCGREEGGGGRVL